MPEPDLWSASVSPSTAGWFTIPPALDHAEVEAWVAASVAALHERFGEEWHVEDDQSCRELLRTAALDRAPDKVLDLIFWPTVGPVAVRLNVRVYPSTPVSEWLDAGFEVDAFDHAALGPGVRCIAEGEAEIAGARHRLITTQFVFDDATHQVQVEIEPTLLELYSLAAVDIVDVVCRLEVARPDEEPFRSRPVPGYTLEDVDTFSGILDG